jgi:glycosyltransferase involved in cell wall biosynthesis
MSARQRDQDPSRGLVIMLINDRITDRRAVQQAISLREKGFRVEFVSARHGNDDPIRVDGFTIHRIEYQALQYFLHHALQEMFVFAPRREVDSLLGEWDAVLKAEIDKAEAHLRNVPDPMQRPARSLVAGLDGFRRMSTLAGKGLGWVATRAAAVPYRVNRLPQLRVLFRRAAVSGVHPRLHHMFAKENVYALQSHDVDTAALGMKLAASLKVPLVFDAHEIYLEQEGLNPFFKKYYAAVEQEVLQKAAFWMIPNNLAGDWLVSYYAKRGIPIQPPLVVQNSVPYWKEYKREPKLRDSLGLSSADRILLYQGGLGPRRNLENIVALHPFLDERWKIVFLGNGAYGEQLGKLAGESLGRKVFFLPAVPQSELLAYTTSADLGVIPYSGIDTNTLFASPNKLYEYLQAGLPFLANQLPFLSQKVAQTGVGETIDFSNPAAVAARVNSFDDETLEGWRNKMVGVRESECWEAEAKPYVARMLALRGTEFGRASRFLGAN